MEVDGNILKETHVDPTNQLENTIITRVFDGNVMNTVSSEKGSEMRNREGRRDAERLERRRRNGGQVNVTNPRTDVIHHTDT